MEEVYVCGIGMTRFGKRIERTLWELSADAVTAALEDAEIAGAGVDAAFFGNAVAGLMTGQEMIRGQVALHHLGIAGVPIFNVENACASASSAFHLAWQSVRSGVHDVVLAVGAEKLVHPEKTRALNAIATAVDIEHRAELAAAMGFELHEGQSFFMEIYASLTREYMRLSGATPQVWAIRETRHRGSSKTDMGSVFWSAVGDVSGRLRRVGWWWRFRGRCARVDARIGL